MDERQLTIEYNKKSVKVNPKLLAERSELFRGYYTDGDSDDLVVTDDHFEFDVFETFIRIVHDDEYTLSVDTISNVISVCKAWGSVYAEQKCHEWEDNNGFLLEYVMSQEPQVEKAVKVAGNLQRLLETDEAEFHNMSDDHLFLVMEKSRPSQVKSVEGSRALFNVLIERINQGNRRFLRFLNYVTAENLTFAQVEAAIMNDAIPEEGTGIFMLCCLRRLQKEEQGIEKIKKSRGGYGNRGRGYGNRGRGYGNRGRGYGNRGRGYANRGRASADVWSEGSDNTESTGNDPFYWKAKSG